MTRSVLLDMTRAVARRLKGQTPSGIDRVCDAYAEYYSAHRSGGVLAVLQIRGRPVILNRAASKGLLEVLDAPTAEFRRSFLSTLVKLPWCLASMADIHAATYLNVGHSDFDLPAHWRFVRKHSLKPYYLLHDLIPLNHPYVTTPHKVARHRGRVIEAAAHAAGIIVTSEVVAKELRDFARGHGLSLPSLLVAPIAGADFPTPLHRKNKKAPMFVSVGTIERRKNYTLLLRVWSLLIDRLGDDAPRLVLAGNWGLGAKDFRVELENDSRLQKHVEIQTGLNDAEIARLMASAHALVLPTLAEGYGLPMAEALGMSVPVIASDLPIFREVGQGIPTLLDPTDTEAWANAICDSCEDGAERQRQLSSLPSFRAPSWKDHFATVESWLKNQQGLGERSSVDSSDNSARETQRLDRKA